MQVPGDQGADRVVHGAVRHVLQPGAAGEQGGEPSFGGLQQGGVGEVGRLGVTKGSDAQGHTPRGTK